MVNIGDKVGKYQVVIEAHGKESAEAIVKEIKKSMPYLEGAISIQEPQEVRPLNEFIENKEKKMETTCDVSILIKDDIVRYINRVGRQFIIDEGKLKQDNQHKEGVEVYGDIDGKEWVQYVSKYYICEVIRDGESIYRNADME